MEYREVLIFKVREKISCIKLLSIIAVFLDWKISEILVFLQLGVINWFKKLFSLLKRVVVIIILKCLTRSTVLGLWIKGHVFFDIWHIYSRATQLVVTNYLPLWTTQMDGPKKHVFQWIPSKETHWNVAKIVYQWMQLGRIPGKYGKLKLLYYLAFSSYVTNVMRIKIIQILERTKQIFIMNFLPKFHALW